MTKDSDDTPRKKPKAGQTIVWGMMALLMVGLGGFGVTSFGGGLTSLGKVGDRSIGTDEYARALQAELSALSAQFGQNIPLSQATQFGVDRQVMQGLVAQAALDNETDRLDLSVGDATVAQRIVDMPAFQGTNGQFDRETYRFTLGRSNLTENGFESQMRNDLARQILTGAVTGGFAAPAILTDTLYNYIGERRGFSLLRLSAADLANPVAEPTEAEIRAFYDANIALFTAPAAKRIRFAALLPDEIAADQPVNDEALRQIYDQRIGDFVQPEKRLVERLVFEDQAAAEAAKARIDAGESFEAMVASRGLELNDIDLGDVSQDELGAAGVAVFALTEPGIVGPFDSSFGPSLFRMNAVLAAQEITFEDARSDLALEIQADAARRAIADKVDVIDDMLVGGANLEDLAKEQGMTLETLDYVADAAAPEGIAAYPAFRKAAGDLRQGDFPEAILLDDGGVVVMEMLEDVPASPIAFETAKADVAAAAKADAEAKAMAARAIEIKAAVEAGAELGAYGIVDRTAAIAREGNVEGAPAALVTALFEMDANEIRVFESAGFTAVVVLDEITAAAAEGDDANAIKGALSAQIEQAISQDTLQLFTNALTSEAGISLDQNAINAIHAQFN